MGIFRFLKHGCGLIFIGIISFFWSCTHIQKEVRAYVEEDPHWKMGEGCGYEHCYPMVDYLYPVGKNIEIRLEALTEYGDQFFVILIEFPIVKDKFEFNPSNVLVKLKNGAQLESKTLGCHMTKGLNELRSAPPLPMQGHIPIKQNACFHLFFDQSSALFDKEEVIVDINRALTSDGKPVDVPLIHFRKVKKLSG